MTAAETHALVEQIATREVEAVARFEWTLNYKRALMQKCELQGEDALVRELRDEIADLEVEASFHVLASALAKGALAGS